MKIRVVDCLWLLMLPKRKLLEAFGCVVFQGRNAKDGSHCPASDQKAQIRGKGTFLC